jgi:riboflavin-specific deaminase-like protein
MTGANERAPEPPRYRLLIGDSDATEPVAGFVGGRRTARGERPWVMINVVESVDGATAVSGESMGLSGPADREVFHALRGIADAIMVGAGTVRADNYGPMRPRPGVREARMARGQTPVAPIVVVSRSLELDWTSALFTDAEAPTVVAAPTDAPESARAAAREAGPLIVAGTGHVALDEVLTELARAGHDSVLCEGGPGLFAQLAQADLLDEVCVAISPVLVAGGAQRVLPGALLVPPRRLMVVALLEADGFVFVRYEVQG